MLEERNVVYVYDGSYEGLLCCVFESYTFRETPIKIVSAESNELFLFDTKDIVTEQAKADRVYKSLSKKMGKEAKELTETAFLIDRDDKADVLYRFICLGYNVGAKVFYMLGNEIVSEVHNMSKAVMFEKHRIIEFVRFSEFNGALISVVEPKHFVLPLIEEHFSSRFPDEQFLIYDKKFKVAIVHASGRTMLVSMESLELPPVEENEMFFRKLWAGYYDAIAIKERINPKCRMNHMPKRFWKHLTEMNVELNGFDALTEKERRAICKR